MGMEHVNLDGDEVVDRDAKDAAYDPRTTGTDPGVLNALSESDTAMGQVMSGSEIATGTQGAYERDERSQKVKGSIEPVNLNMDFSQYTDGAPRTTQAVQAGTFGGETPVSLDVDIEIPGALKPAEIIDMKAAKLKILMGKLEDAKARGDSAAQGVIEDELRKAA